MHLTYFLQHSNFLRLTVVIEQTNSTWGKVPRSALRILVIINNYQDSQGVAVKTDSRSALRILVIINNYQNLVIIDNYQDFQGVAVKPDSHTDFK